MKKLLIILCILPFLSKGQITINPSGNPINISLSGNPFVISTPIDSITVSMLAYWNFNVSTNQTTLFTPTSGTGSITYTAGGSSAIQTTSNTGQGFEIDNPNARNGDPSLSHVRYNSPNASTYITFSVPTTGKGKILVQYATRRSSASAAEQQVVSYSLNGSTFTTLTTLSIGEAPEVKTLNFANILGANNNPNFKIRIGFAQGSGGTGGNHRIENFTVESGGGIPYVPPIVPVEPTPPLFTSTLPIIRIFAPGYDSIPRGTNVASKMMVIGTNDYNTTKNSRDSNFSFESDVVIEVRGNSSDSTAGGVNVLLKQMNVKFATAVALLDLPANKDFILQPYAIDPSKVRTAVGYALERETGIWAIKTYPVEVIINGDYRAFYYLQEKDTRDPARINVDANTSSATAASGGWIWEWDWTSLPYWDTKDSILTTGNSFFLSVYPKAEDFKAGHRSYAESFMTYVEDKIVYNYNPNWRDSVDEESLVRVAVATEVLTPGDAWKYSVTMSKKNGTSKLKFEHVYDLDYSQDWQFDNICAADVGGANGFYYKRDGVQKWVDSLMTKDSVFKRKVMDWYSHMRDSTYSVANYTHLIDSFTNIAKTSGAIERTKARGWSLAYLKSTKDTGFDAAALCYHNYPARRLEGFLDPEWDVRPKTPTNINGGGDGQIYARWDSLIFADNYDLQIVTDTGSMAGLQAFNTNNTYRLITGLSNGTSYYIRVRSNRVTFNPSAYSGFVKVIPNTFTPVTNQNIIWSLVSGGAFTQSADTLFYGASTTAKSTKYIGYTSDSVIAHISYHTYLLGVGTYFGFTLNSPESFASTINMTDPLQQVPHIGVSYTGYSDQMNVDVYLTQTGADYYIGGVFKFKSPYRVPFPIKVITASGGSGGHYLSGVKITGGNVY